MPEVQTARHRSTSCFPVRSTCGCAGPGAEADVDPALTRLALAVVRGLLLDLVATGARAETTAALRRFVELLNRSA